FNTSRGVCTVLGVFGACAALLALAYAPPVTDPAAPEMFFSGVFISDRLSLIFKIIFYLGAIFTLLFSERSSELSRYRFGEYSALVLGAVLSASFLASANNFVLFLLAFETLSLCCYVLAAYDKHARLPGEAALKYLLYGAVASSIMLFGLSYIYGLTQTLSIDRSMVSLAEQAVLGTGTLVVYLSMLLVLTGIGFKIAMFPFHFWCPDVYQGAPTPVAAFLSVVSKAAGFAALLRLAAPVISAPQLAAYTSPVDRLQAMHLLFGLAACITMTYGNLAALRQTNAKRLLAYSSIAHAGYLLLGLAVFRSDAVEAMLAYLIIYTLMNLGAFWVVILLVRETGSSEIDSFAGAAFKSPLLFAVLFLCLISLTGLPPTAGFAAKFLLFKSVIAAGIDAMGGGARISLNAAYYFALALAGVLNSAVSLFYYMKFARKMVFEKQPNLQFACTRLEAMYALALGLPLLLLLDFDPLLDLVSGVLNPVLPTMLTLLK
ncbi:MAG TPA: NADH-quinone oxidoreductase subunit N, partial [Oligoflexia bacterium]|nr:NADH-quinone oxidoreductase subunit N [Oligoflexia bacterium]